jgi:DNA-binding response OmpR family regulator
MSARVLVAHESEPIRAVITTLLEDAGYQVTAVAEGVAARDALVRKDWEALIVDVALSGVLSFEIVEDARLKVPSPRVILVASIYNRTSYKRRPTSLYGADDYIEQHHIADALLQKLGRFLRPDESSPKEKDHAAAERVREGAAAVEAAPRDDGEAKLRAQRLARLIVSDIALYNGEAVAAARAAGEAGMERLEARLRNDLEEGRLLFDLRVSQSVRRGRDYIDEALRDLLRGTLPVAGGG